MKSTFGITALTLVVGTFSAAVVLKLYKLILRRWSKGRSPGLNSLQARLPGEGKAGRKWSLRSEQHDGVEGLTWLEERELRVLEALSDTLLPGFEVGTAESASTVIEESVAVFRAQMFRGKDSSATTSTPLPPAVESYTRAVAGRCLEMQGRPASDVGVAGLLAEAYEANITPEKRSGLRLLLSLLSTRLGALSLTGRAVPIPSQDLASRHAMLKWWSTSRLGKLREAFQGIKRLTSSLYFSAHPEEIAAESSEINMAAIKTNPNWDDIRYEPQHHRFVRDGPPTQEAAAPSHSLRPGAGGKVIPAARSASEVISPSARSSDPSLPPSVASASTAAPSASNFSSRAEAVGDNHSVVGTGRSGSVGARESEGEAPAATAATTAATASTTGTTGAVSADVPPSKLMVDVVIVGSGAGGGCAAGVLASKGLKVAVLEKGGLYDRADFAGFSEMEAYRRLYERQGLLVSTDSSVVVFAGSCVGGGTTVNWSASFRTPRHVRVEWARKMGLKSFDLGGPFDKALDAVCERLEVNTEFSHRAPGCSAPASLRINQHQTNLWNGAVASGRTPRVIPRNAKGCVDCGSCMYGCAFGNKRSTHVTWLQDGLDSGNIILVPNAKVDRVLMDAGRATGVTATVTPLEGGGGSRSGQATLLEVEARAVVISGGAIHTPAILLRSGLKHPKIGRHLRLHPVLVVGGLFPEDYREETGDAGGPPQDTKVAPPADLSAVAATDKQDAVKASSEARLTEEARLERPGIGPRVAEFGRGVMMGCGCVIEAPPGHPGLAGLVLPWNDCLSHRLLVAMQRETSVFICIGRDRSSADNRISLDPRGGPVTNYKLGKEDRRVLLKGRSEMIRLLRSAGASMIVPSHEGAPWFCPQVGEGADEEFEEYVEAMEALGAPINEASVFSAHQMGSCRLSATREGGPLRETGEAWECDGLFVADASTFPTSLGINPMITIEAIAYMVAEQVAANLGKVERDTAAGETEILSYNEPLETPLTQQTAEGDNANPVHVDFVKEGTVDGQPVIPSKRVQVASGAEDDFGVDFTW